MAVPWKHVERELQRIRRIERQLFTELYFFFVRHAASQANNSGYSRAFGRARVFHNESDADVRDRPGRRGAAVRIWVLRYG